MKPFPSPFVFALFGLLLIPVARAAESAAIMAVRAADNARLAAMMAGDGPALARLMSDELTFVHSDGRIESKADYVRNMTAGDTEYAGAMTSDVQALEPAASVVVLIGAQEMRKRLGSTWSDISLRYMAVWRNEAGKWRMFAWQSMRPAGNSVVPPSRDRD
jgi:ketosteroid isomerase-like protein